jgi:hypothetical protein
MRLPAATVLLALLASCGDPPTRPETFNDRDTLPATVPEGAEARWLRVSRDGRVAAHIVRMKGNRDYVVSGHRKGKVFELV